MTDEQDEVMRRFEMAVEKRLRELMADNAELWCDEVTLQLVVKEYTKKKRQELIMKMKSFQPPETVLDDLFEGNKSDESDFVPPRLVEGKKEHIHSKKKAA